jgi:NAD(P)H-flavin reductase
VMYHALRHRDRFRRVFLLYGTREPRDLLFREELQAWRARFDLEVEVTVDRGGTEWGGNVGVVTRLIERGGFDPATVVAMLCGPEVMMHFSVLALARKGVAGDRIWVSMERNMKCAIGHCGHCQFLPHFVCKDGPVFRYDRIAPLFDVKEL